MTHPRHVLTAVINRAIANGAPIYTNQLAKESAMTKRPYSFPHKSRAAIENYLSDREHYHPMNSWNGGFVLAWDIKVHSFDETGKAATNRKPGNDSAWRDYLEENSSMFWDICADATSQFTDSDWSNYPGIEQGQWHFGINGRSGGHMILMDCPAWLSKPQGWACCRMTWDSHADYSAWLQELPFDMLRRFYRAIRVLDSDLSREACRREIEHQYSFRREIWESDLDQTNQDSANAMEKSRPDMYSQS